MMYLNKCFFIRERLLAFWRQPNADLLENDPLMILSNELIAHYFSAQLLLMKQRKIQSFLPNAC